MKPIEEMTGAEFINHLIYDAACPATCGFDCRCECRLTVRHMMNEELGWGTHDYGCTDFPPSPLPHDRHGNPCPWGPVPEAYLARRTPA